MAMAQALPCPCGHDQGGFACFRILLLVCLAGLPRLTFHQLNSNFSIFLEGLNVVICTLVPALLKLFVLS